MLVNPIPVLFHPIPPYSSPIPAYSKLFQFTPSHSGLFPPIQSYSSHIQPIPALFKDNLAYSSLFKPNPSYSSHIHGYSSLFKPIPAKYSCNNLPTTCNIQDPVMDSQRHESAYPRECECPTNIKNQYDENVFKGA